MSLPSRQLDPKKGSPRSFLIAFKACEWDCSLSLVNEHFHPRNVVMWASVAKKGRLERWTWDTESKYCGQCGIFLTRD